ncbi:hypothetical protein N479_02715 [Pseudoalteromonas luteoviolacea S4054]|uniref:Uncharacterized protein n=1 Tax=Pseudoalteromonas luteoviolacea S4054 TaxID=1129367 RepID=A0A0F6A6F7_9GAMM|nr:hypothetical protein N479_02715 [Pseudoalteromonas luteoviolacea S4054]
MSIKAINFEQLKVSRFIIDRCGVSARNASKKRGKAESLNAFILI